MGIIDRFVEGYMKRKGLNPFPVTQPKIQGINSSILQQYGADSYVSEGYLSNSDVYAIVSFLARKAGSIPWYVYKMKPGAKAQTALQQYKQLTKGLQHKGAYEQALIKRKSAYEENMVTNSPLAKLLEQPNPQQAQDQFFENLYGYRILSGEGNIYGNDGGIEGAKFVELNVLPTQFLDIYPDPKDLYGLLGYKLMVGAGIDLPKEQVCQWKSWNPDFNADTRSHMRGLSPLRPGWKLLRMSNNAADASAAMTSNGGAKGAIVPRPVNNSVPSLTPEQASLVQRMVNDRVNNKDQKGAIGVFQTPWDYLNFGLSSVDMELVKTMQMTLHQWCRLFGLPVVLFDTDSSSYNNYSNAMRDLITNTIMPLNCQLRDELNKWLVPRFGEDVYIDFDISALPEMQQDMERMVNQLRMADWLTFDEKRVAMNYEERGGAYAFSYVNQGLLPLEQVTMDLTVSNDQSGNMDNGDSQIS
jgi:HK97 family phage portal protein